MVTCNQIAFLLLQPHQTHQVLHPQRTGSPCDQIMFSHLNEDYSSKVARGQCTGFQILAPSIGASCRSSFIP